MTNKHIVVDDVTLVSSFATSAELSDDLGGPGGPDAVAWGDIGGTIAEQGDLQTALDGKQAAGSYDSAGAAEAAYAAAIAASTPVSHEALTTAAHGGIVASNDARLTDARSASDVSAWAKAGTKPAYTAAEVGADASGLAAAAQAASLPLHSKADTAGAADTAVALAAGTDRTKLDGIAAGAEVNVQADWNAGSGDAQILNKPAVPLTNWKCGQTTYNVATTSGAQNIAHGLSRVPKLVHITAMMVFSAGVSMECYSTYDGAAQSGQCIIWTEGTTTATSDNIYSSTAAAVGLCNAGGVNPFTGATKASGIITVDATNIIITWTKSGSPTGTAQLAWECT